MITPQKISQIRSAKLVDPKKINLILEKKDLDRLKIRAIELETSVNELIRCAVLSWLGYEKKELTKGENNENRKRKRSNQQR